MRNDFALLSLFTTFFFDLKVDFIDLIILKKTNVHLIQDSKHKILLINNKDS